MLTIRKEQIDALRRARWRAYAPRVAAFLCDAFGDAWISKPTEAREDTVALILATSERLGFQKLASVFKFAGLVVGTEGAFLADQHAIAYIKGHCPDLQLSRLIKSMEVNDALSAPISDRRGPWQ